MDLYIRRWWNKIYFLSSKIDGKNTSRIMGNSTDSKETEITRNDCFSLYLIYNMTITLMSFNLYWWTIWLYLINACPVFSPVLHVETPEGNVSEVEVASNVEAGNDVVDDDVDFGFLRRFVDRTARNGDFFEQNLFFERSCCRGNVNFVRVKDDNIF